MAYYKNGKIVEETPEGQEEIHLGDIYYEELFGIPPDVSRWMPGFPTPASEISPMTLTPSSKGTIGASGAMSMMSDISAWAPGAGMGAKSKKKVPNPFETAPWLSSAKSQWPTWK